jgi:hypothetical protein
VENRTDYDVKVAREAGSLVVVRNDGTEIDRFPNGPEAGTRLREALLGTWRRHFLAQLRQDAPDAEVRLRLRLVPVEVERVFGGNAVRVLRDLPVVPDQNGTMTLRAGDHVMLELHNASTLPIYLTVLDLTADGRILPLYPHPEVGEEARPPLAPGQTLRLPNPYVFKLDPPPGREVFKAIGTQTRVDLSGVVFDPKRGQDTPPGPGRALVQLLRYASTGKRSADQGPMDAAYWGTSEVHLNLLAR